MDKNIEKKLQDLANAFRLTVVKMIYDAGSGHIGGSLSAAEILTALYFHILKIKPKEPHWPNRDRLVVSKGHCAPLLYAILAKRGFFPMEWLTTLRRINSKLQGHPDMLKTPGIEISTGSLGHGLSVGIGMALGGRLSKKDFYTFVFIGDGELDEGQIWEGAMAASKYGLERLTTIVDRNLVQLDGPTSHIMPLEPLRAKWKAFGWNVVEINGHKICEIVDAVTKIKKAYDKKPTVIIAYTIKGKGVSFMENTHIYHGKRIETDEYERAVKELKSNAAFEETEKNEGILWRNPRRTG